MQERKLFQIFTEKFNELNVPYMVTGSVASIVYGEPRLTHDIDIVITIPLVLIEKFTLLFPEKEFYIPPVEILRNEIMRDSRGHCNIIHNQTGFKADIYFAGNSEFQHWALENVRSIDFGGEKMPIAPIEYVIIKKLEFYKEGNAQKHIRDIKAMLDNSNDLIDKELLGKYLDQFGLRHLWLLCE